MMTLLVVLVAAILITLLAAWPVVGWILAAIIGLTVIAYVGDILGVGMLGALVILACVVVLIAAFREKSPPTYEIRRHKPRDDNSS